MIFTIPIAPRTKKNHSEICYNPVTKMRFVRPSKIYQQFEKDCGYFIPQKLKNAKIKVPINIKCTYYMDTKRAVDLPNLLNATDDILVHYGVLEDDNCRIIVSHDGSRVYYDKEKPRTVIEITKSQDLEFFPIVEKKPSKRAKNGLNK